MRKAWRCIEEELTPRLIGDGRRTTAAPEDSPEDVTLLHELSACTGTLQLEPETFTLPILWMYSSTTARQLTVHSSIDFACLNSKIAVTKSGGIVQLSDKNIVIFDENGDVVRTFSVGLEFNQVAVDSKGLIWACPSRWLHKSELWCFTEEGKIVGVKELPPKMVVERITFRGDELVIVEAHSYKSRILFYTTIFEDPPRTTVCDIDGGTYIYELKVCIRTGVIYILQSHQICAISTDNKMSVVELDGYNGYTGDMMIYNNIKCIDVTVNGDLLLCDNKDQISLFTPNGKEGHFSRLMSIDIVVTVTSMLSLPKQQIALVSAYADIYKAPAPGTIVVLDV